MTTTELSATLTKLLKRYIKSEGYYSSGKLYNSINFIVTDSSTTGLHIELDSKEYINYIDDGKFLDKFFALPNVQNEILEYGIDKIYESIEDIDI